VEVLTSECNVLYKRNTSDQSKCRDLHPRAEKGVNEGSDLLDQASQHFDKEILSMARKTCRYSPEHLRLV